MCVIHFQRVKIPGLGSVLFILISKMLTKITVRANALTCLSELYIVISQIGNITFLKSPDAIAHAESLPNIYSMLSSCSRSKTKCRAWRDSQSILNVHKKKSNITSNGLSGWFALVYFKTLFFFYGVHLSLISLCWEQVISWSSEVWIEGFFCPSTFSFLKASNSINFLYCDTLLQ